MAYSDLPSKSSGSVFGLSDYNQIRDNFDAGVPDIFSVKGDIAVATGSDAAARLAVGANHAELIPDSSQATGLRWQIRPLCKVYNASVIDPDPNDWRAINWDSESFDTNGMHSTASNTNRLTCVSGAAGVYRVEANLGFNSSSLTPGQTGHYGVRITKNGTTVNATEFGEEEPTYDTWKMVGSLIELAVGDYVVCQCYTTQDVNILQGSWFSISFLRGL